MALVRDFQSFAGPSDRDLRMNEIEGYQPISRIGEVVINAYVDSYDWSLTPENVTGTALVYNNMDAPENGGLPFEFRPAYAEWATVLPGMVTVQRKKKTHSNYNYAADTAAGVIVCAACKTQKDEGDYTFAGVARSKSVPPHDDGMGPSHDEMFTVALAGMVTVLNTSGSVIHAGDMIGWSFAGNGMRGTNLVKRQKSGPRRVAIVQVAGSSPNVIGRALSFAKSGEPLDILLRP